MSASKTRPTTSRRQELREDRLITFYARAWQFFDEHRRLVYGALAGLVLLVLVAIGCVIYLDRQQAEAEQLLGPAVSAYEAENYRAALDGSAGQPGLLAIAEDYGRTQAGNLATFYAADALYQLGEYDRALAFFQEVDKEENLLGASALAGEAAIYENQEEYEQAGQHYEEAAELYANEAVAPQYLLSAGRAYEAAGAYEAARAAYEEVRERYPETEEAEEAAVYLARVRARAQDG